MVGTAAADHVVMYEKTFLIIVYSLLLIQICSGFRPIENIFNVTAQHTEEEVNALNDRIRCQQITVIDQIELLIEKKSGLVDLPSFLARKPSLL